MKISLMLLSSVLLASTAVEARGGGFRGDAGVGDRGAIDRNAGDNFQYDRDRNALENRYNTNMQYQGDGYYNNNLPIPQYYNTQPNWNDNNNNQPNWNGTQSNWNNNRNWQNRNNSIQQSNDRSMRMDRRNAFGLDSTKDTDTTLKTRVQDSINSNKNLNNVRIVVENRRVILTGTIPNEQERQFIRSRINQIEGIDNVDDRLEVRNDTARTSGRFDNFNSSYSANQPETTTQRQNPDAELRTKIKSELKPGFFSKGYETVEVDVMNGRVLLTGVVPSEADKKDVVDRVRKVKGIQDVENRLAVQPSTKR